MTEKEFDNLCGACRNWSPARILDEIMELNLPKELVFDWIIKHIGLGESYERFKKMYAYYEKVGWI